jgi:NTE family protein
MGRTAFVFAGGGSLGAIQVGTLRELIAAGKRPDFLVGASVGALNACFFAGQPDREGVAALEAIWRGLRRQDVFPLTLSGVIDGLRGAPSLVSAGSLRRLVERSLTIRDLEDAPVPVHVVATDLSGAAVRLSRGNAVDAVLASAAIPIAFPAVEIDGAHLIDGAIAGNTPLLTAAGLGAERIVVLQTGYACSIDGPPRGAIAGGLHALTLLIANQMARDLQLVGDRVEVHVAPHLCPLDVSPFNFEHSGALIERAAQSTRLWLAGGGLKRCARPDDIAHDHAGMATPAGEDIQYDLVSYFDNASPLPGLTAHSAMHDGVTHTFASAANRDRFLAEPHRYLPQYGGLCAFAMAQGKSVAGDPGIYAMRGGRLFYNVNARVHEQWLRDAEANIRRADEAWRRRAQSA